MKRVWLIVILALAAMVSNVSLALAIDDYLVHTFSIPSSSCNETSGVSGNSTLSLSSHSNIINHQFSWYTYNSTSNNTAVSGNLTLWADSGVGSWMQISNGTTYHSDRAIVSVTGKFFKQVRVEMDKYFKNATSDADWTTLRLNYIGWSQ